MRENHRGEEQVEKNSHVLKKPAEKKSFRCFVAVEEIEKLNSSLLTAMYQQFNAKLPRGMIANHIWIYERCLTARHKDAVRLNDVY